MDTTTRQPLTLYYSARDKVLRHHDTSIRARQTLTARMVTQGTDAAYAQLVQEVCPELSEGQRDDVADMVRLALRARLPRTIRRVHRAGSVA